MDPAATIRDCRRAAGLTQAELARRAGTSQATLSAYETGAKQPSLDILSKLLAALDARLAIAAGAPRTLPLSSRDQARTSRTLIDVLALAERLPTRHEPELRYPPLAAATY
ncbi:MAG: helix-turn-helix transcriptional regulator [Thermoleophilaceae bacterium]|nr:helix-turn-helix transcriptional regulator [Thermoleophilaceae bacterium]